MVRFSCDVFQTSYIEAKNWLIFGLAFSEVSVVPEVWRILQSSRKGTLADQ